VAKAVKFSHFKPSAKADGNIFFISAATEITRVKRIVEIKSFTIIGFKFITRKKGAPNFRFNAPSKNNQINENYENEVSIFLISNF